MARSASGTAILMAASVGIILSMGACAGTENGPVIGTPAQASAPVAAAEDNLSLSGLQQQLATQLQQAEQTQSDPGGSVFAAEVAALVSDQALLSSERISQLQQLGDNQIVTLEGELTSLTGDVQNTSGLSSGQAGAIENVIRQVNDQLQSLAAKIAADTLVDVLRTDVLSVDSSTRVEGLISPEVHTALGADSLLVAANLLSTQAASLSTRIQANVGVNQANEEQTLGNLQGDITSMNSTGSSVAAQALALSPSGFPGNQGEMASLNSELSASSGLPTSGHQEVASISTCLADDQVPQTC
jgi:hypothetical protein